MSSRSDPTRVYTAHDDVPLSEFFARPILIASFNWTPGSAFTGGSFNPWSAFLTNPRVANRISNFQNASMKLHVKFLVNGNSFYYGRLMPTYIPLFNDDVQYAVSGGLGGTQTDLVTESQRLHLFLDPCTSQGGTMELPFMWYYDMVNMVNGDYTKLGVINMRELSGLKHANGATTPVTISVYCWASNVSVSGPTVVNMSGIVAQAGDDEYGNGILSRPASTIARTAGKLNNMPMIGPYMRATEIAAGAMAKMAVLFGYSRPTAIDLPTAMRPSYISNLAVTDVPDHSGKLTVDSKQELSIDPAIVGVGQGDEMTLCEIAKRQSYVWQFPWTIARVAGDHLFSARVMPQLPVYSTGATPTMVLPACGFVATPFTYWRGTMRYRFMIVASDYHKGRLKFVYDPYGTPSTSIGESNVQYTRIVDLANERDFTIDVAWAQGVSWLTTVDNGVLYMRNNASYSNNNSYANGCLSVYVLNDLVSSNSAINNDITVNVFVSMCDDAEFAVPHDRITTYGLAKPAVAQSGIDNYVFQAGDVESSSPEGNEPIVADSTENILPCAPLTDPMSLIYFGEEIKSFRQLIKRFALSYSYNSVAWSSGVGYFTFDTSDFPLERSYHSFGLRGTTPNFYDLPNTTMMRYLCMGFIAYRGGIRRKYVANSTGAQAGPLVVSVSRNTTNNTFVNPAVTTMVTTTQSDATDARLGFLSSGVQGMHITTTPAQPNLEVELPFYRRERFVHCRPPNKTGGPGATISVDNLTHHVSAIVNSKTCNFDVFVAGAEDASFFCFQGMAPCYINPTLV